jgi:hypothetical protein
MAEHTRSESVEGSRAVPDPLIRLELLLFKSRHGK